MPVSFEEVSCIYNPGTPLEKSALGGISFSIQDGEFVVFRGAPGSGKSSLIQLMGGLLKPSGGRITNTFLTSNRTGVVFQFPERQFFEETLYMDISYPLRRLGLTDEEIEKRVRQALHAVDLEFEGYHLRAPFELSSGEKRRAAIAAVLVLDPLLLVLDEPLTGLDKKGRTDLLEELKRQQRDAGKTIVIATQDGDPYLSFCDRVIQLVSGSMEQFHRLSRPASSTISTLTASLKEKGIDLGEGIVSIDDAFLRINRCLSKAS